MMILVPKSLLCILSILEENLKVTETMGPESADCLFQYLFSVLFFMLIHLVMLVTKPEISLGVSIVALSTSLFCLCGMLGRPS